MSAVLRSDGTQTHWGAIVFTMAAGAALFAFVVAPTLGEVFRASVPAERDVTPTPTASPAPPAHAVAPTAEELGAELVRLTAPRLIQAGSTATVTVVLKNTGTVPWVKGTPAEARLGVVGEDPRLHELGMAVEWPYPTRPALQDAAIVEPGQTAQFTFRVQGTEPGLYELHLAPLVEGVAWMDAPASTEIRVE